MSLDTLETFPSGTERLSLSALGRASIVFALGGLAYKGVALLSIPLLARLLSPAELGLLDLAAVLASLVGLVAVLGGDQALAFRQPRAESTARLWGSALAIVGSAAVAMAILGVIFQGPLAEVLTGDETNGPVVAAASVYGGAIAFSTLALTSLRLHGTAARYAIVSFLIVTAEMAVAVAIALAADGPVPLMVLGWFAGASIVAIPALVRSLPAVAMPRVSDMAALVRFGAPLVPAAIAWVAGDAIIRAALAREAEASALGEYGIAYRVASVLGLVVTGFGIAWYPYLYRSPASEIAPRASQALRVLVVSLAAVGIGLIALSPEIIAVVAGEPYAGARAAIGSLVGGMIALGVFVLLSAVVGARGATGPVAFAAAVGVGVQAAAATAFVDDVAPAGVASAAGYVIAATVLAVVARRELAEPRLPVTLALIALAAVSVLVASVLAADAGIEARLAMALAAASTAGLLAWVLGRWARQP